MMIGVRRPALRKPRQTSKPSLPGSITSSRIRSKDRLGPRCTAAAPSTNQLHVPAFEPQIVFQAEGDSGLVFGDENSGHEASRSQALPAGNRTLERAAAADLTRDATSP